MCALWAADGDGGGVGCVGFCGEDLWECKGGLGGLCEKERKCSTLYHTYVSRKEIILALLAIVRLYSALEDIGASSF